MGYCCGNTKQTRAVNLILKRQQLLYDASNYSFVEADIMDAKDEHARHQVADIAESGNVDLATRILNLAYWQCVEMLFPYTKRDMECMPGAPDDNLSMPEAYVIEMNVPQDFSATTVMLLEHLIHDYMVCRVLAEWMSITKRDGAANWVERSERMAEEIRSSIMSRTGKIRRRLSPF